MIRVLILASSPAQERELAEQLEEDGRAQVLQDIREQPDVVLVANDSRAEFPEHTRAVFLGGSDLPKFHLNARAWLPRHASIEQIWAAICAADLDLTTLTREQAGRHLPALDAPATNGEMLEALTNREMQVLRMVADGLANKEIAGRLGISDHTAKFHVAQILAKLGANSRTEAVTIAIRRGLVPI